MVVRLVAVFGVMMAFSQVVVADGKAEIMRGIVAEHGEAVVTVKMAIKETMSMAEYGSEVSEYTQEIHATVISSEGLMVTSLMQLDPGSLMESMFFDEAGDDEGFETKTEVTALKVLRDKEEIDAEIVLRDSDLDLAFLRPVKKPEAMWAHVDLTAAPTVALFDPVYLLGRMGQVANRLPTVGEMRIQGIVEKPRAHYIVGEYPGMGMPIFTESGVCLGINLTRMLKISGNSGMGYTSGYTSNMACVVLPGADVVELLEQVPAYAEAK